VCRQALVALVRYVAFARIRTADSWCAAISSALAAALERHHDQQQQQQQQSHQDLLWVPGFLKSLLLLLLPVVPPPPLMLQLEVLAAAAAPQLQPEQVQLQERCLEQLTSLLQQQQQQQSLLKTQLQLEPLQKQQFIGRGQQQEALNRTAGVLWQELEEPMQPAALGNTQQQQQEQEQEQEQDQQSLLPQGTHPALSRLSSRDSCSEEAAEQLPVDGALNGRSSDSSGNYSQQSSTRLNGAQQRQNGMESQLGLASVPTSSAAAAALSSQAAVVGSRSSDSEDL
jgi:hypothetical protein